MPHSVDSGNWNECNPQLSYLVIYFTCGVNMMRQRRLHVWRGFEQSVIGQHACVLVFVPMVDILNIFVTITLFSPNIMNFMIHITLDAVGTIMTFMNV